MPLAVVEGSPELKFFRSTSCLSISEISPFHLSSCLRTEAMYEESAGLEDAGFALLLVSPTTETPPFALGISSFVQTFFGFFVSAGGVESCADAGGGEAELS